MYVRVAAGFSQFSKNIPKPFLVYITCTCAADAPQVSTANVHVLRGTVLLSHIHVHVMQYCTQVHVYIHVHV